MKKYFTDLLLIIGAALIVAGVAMIHVPAAFIVGGLQVIGFAYLVEREKAHHAIAE